MLSKNSKRLLPPSKRVTRTLLALVLACVVLFAPGPMSAQGPAPISFTPWMLGFRIWNVTAQDADLDGDDDFMGTGGDGSQVNVTNVSAQLGTNPDGTPQLVAVGTGAFGRPNPRFWDGNGDGFAGYVTAGVRGLYYRDRNAGGLAGAAEIELVVPLCGGCLAAGNLAFVDVGDINGDSTMDVVATGTRHNPHIRVFLNNGGTLVPGTVITQPAGDTSGVKLKDMDNDGDLDIVFAKWVEPGWPYSATIYRNDGGGTFTPIGFTTIVGGVEPYQLAVADANNDGLMDIFVAGHFEALANGQIVPGSTGGVWLYTNQGGMQFTARKVLTGAIMGFDAGDLNRDGNADIALSYRGEYQGPHAFAGDGAGGFTEVWSNGNGTSSQFAVDVDSLRIVQYNGRPALATGGYYASWLYADFSPPGSPDSDGDGVPDDEDAFPDDPAESRDSDADGVGDNGDAFPDDPMESRDSDGDGVGDNGDAFPNDPAESRDSDGDGVGDNGDAFPNNPAESRDSDGDGVGDNGDAFPNNPAETRDSDGDGVGNNADAFPNDPTETRDSDGDGVGDNRDLYPQDPSASANLRLAGTGTSVPARYGAQQILTSGEAACSPIRNHGQYVSCVGKVLNGLKAQSLITETEKGLLQSIAAQSSIGKK